MRSEISIGSTHINDIEYDGSIRLVDDNSITRKPMQLVINNEDCGYYDLREKSFNGIYISHWESQFNKHLKLADAVSNPVLSMHFTLEGEVMTSFKNAHSFSCKKGQSNIFSAAEGVLGHINFSKNNRFKGLGIALDETYLQKLTNNYPHLFTHLYDQYLGGKLLCQHKNFTQTSTNQNLVITQMNNANMMGNCCDLYLESKVLELLSLQLHEVQNNKYNSKKRCRCSRDIDKIHEAKAILIANSDNPPTILELSKRVGINDHKLKNGFKEVFNQTVYGYLFDYKMNMARQLILDTDKTIFEVAIACGYGYASHFTTAFKRKYGVSPKEFRK